MADPLEPVGALSALGDPTRRSAYDYVSAQGRPVGRDEVATALGIGRTLGAYHLDRLAKEGLLSVAYARRSGRRARARDGPPSSTNARIAELAVSVPPRDYGLAARLLAHAAAQDEQGGTRRALCDAAEALGRDIAATATDPRDLDRLLRERGYEPYEDDAGVVRLRNCPFHAVARSHPEVVCDMNLACSGGSSRALTPRRRPYSSPEPGAAASQSSPSGTPKATPRRRA